MQQNIRNFCIIAHVDHGKSTLADRLLEKTGTIPPREMREQVLDSLELERERGVTIKLKAVRMRYHYQKNQNAQDSNSSKSNLQMEHADRHVPVEQFYILNLIDTPGHVDFGYEVSRSLAACEGALLVVDATQGIQAQTVANYHKAKAQNLKIIPVVNKIDLPNALPEKVGMEIQNAFGFEKNEIIFASAKTGEGVDEILKAIVERIPPPQGFAEKPLRALVFDSTYDEHRGVVAFVKVVDGEIKNEETLFFMQTSTVCDPKEIGYLTPDFTPISETLVVTPSYDANEERDGRDPETSRHGAGRIPQLQGAITTGEVGYVATGLKDMAQVRVGDTVTISNIKDQRSKIDEGIKPLPGYKEPKAMVFESFYPEQGHDFDKLKSALEKLRLQDASLKISPEANQILGRGFRLGFLGLFHAEIIKERVKREFEVPLIVTLPTVAYEVTEKSGEVTTIQAAGELPEPTKIKEIKEPWVRAIIFTPPSFFGAIMKLCQESRGLLLEQTATSETVGTLVYELPLAEIIFDFFDRLKSVSQGFASLDYDFLEYRSVDIVKLDLLLHGELAAPLSRLVLREEAQKIGQAMVVKIKEILPREQFAVAIQAAVGGKILARETLPAMKKDVLAKLSGGHQERKLKVLQRQKRGKEQLAKFGKVTLPPEAFKRLV